MADWVYYWNKSNFFSLRRRKVHWGRCQSNESSFHAVLFTPGICTGNSLPTRYCGWERPQILLIQVFDREGLSSVSIDNNNCRKNQLLQFYNCIIVMPFIYYYFLVNYLYAYINYLYWCSVSTNIHTIELLHVHLQSWEHQIMYSYSSLFIYWIKNIPSFCQ